MGGDVSFYDLTEQYPDEASAIRYFEAKRWPNGARCPGCGSADVLRGRQEKRRRQLWYCHGCRDQFSVTSGTVMNSTKLPLRKWLFAFHLMGASKKGISSLQLSRMLRITYKTAWHLTHRIRETMTENGQKFTGIVETDETYIGGKRKGRGRGFRGNKMAVQTIVKRNKQGQHDGKAQTIALNTSSPDGRTVGAKLRTHTEPEKTVLMTDESPIYAKVGESFDDHHTVNHKREDYAHVAPDGHLATTNTAEGLFANLKRQIVGTHHHTSKKHLPRYLEEYDFKYNTREGTDTERSESAIGAIEGKRLTLYKPAGGGASLFDRKPGEPAPIVKGEPTPEPEPRPKRAVRKSGSTTGEVPSGDPGDDA